MLSKRAKSKPSECSFFCIGGHEYGRTGKPYAGNGQSQSIIIENCHFDSGGKYLFINDISVPLDTYAEEVAENTIEFAQKRKIGVYNTTLSGICIIDTRAHISNVMSLSNVVVEANSSIINCAYVCSPLVMEFRGFGEGVSLSVGPESQGREIITSIKLTYTEVCKRIIQYQKEKTDESDDNNSSSSSSSTGSNEDILKNKLTLIGRGSVLVNCPVIVNSLICDGCICRNASIQNCIIGENAKIINSAIENSLLHHNTSVTDALEVDTVMMYDHATIGKGARVVSSILAPDASLAGGECHHSLLGPMIGFHHTSLLISTIWPFGRGNIAYGAKVGANHTGRSNDQECFIGEGLFFGLGASVKFPQNLVASPYSIVAAGTLLPPQRVSFPFSLISPGDQTLGNSIAPGWLIWANPYMIERAEMKFKSRRKSTECSTDHVVFRRSIVDMMISARDRLKCCASSSDPSPKYTERDVEGLGKCYLTEKDRIKGVDAYNLQIKQYLFRGLLLFYDRILQLASRRESRPSTNPKNTCADEKKKFFQPLLDDLYLFIDNDDNGISADTTNDDILYILSLLKQEFEIEDEKVINLAYVRKCFGSMLLLEKNYLDKIVECRKRDEVPYAYTIHFIFSSTCEFIHLFLYCMCPYICVLFTGQGS